MASSRKREGFAGEIRDRDIRREAELAFESFKAHVIRTIQTRGRGFGPADSRFAGDANAR